MVGHLRSKVKVKLHGSGENAIMQPNDWRLRDRLGEQGFVCRKRQEERRSFAGMHSGQALGFEAWYEFGKPLGLNQVSGSVREALGLHMSTLTSEVLSTCEGYKEDISASSSIYGSSCSTISIPYDQTYRQVSGPLIAIDREIMHSRPEPARCNRQNVLLTR